MVTAIASTLKKQLPIQLFEEDHDGCPYYYRRGWLAWQVFGGR